MNKHRKTVFFVLLLVLVILCVLMFPFLNRGEEVADHFDPLSCMSVEKNEDHCLLHTKTLTDDYQMIYSLYFESFYMQDEVWAKQKYHFLKENILQKKPTLHHEEKISSDLSIDIIVISDEMIILARNGCSTYHAWGKNTDREKKQKWLDIMEIPYSLPEFLFKK